MDDNKIQIIKDDEIDLRALFQVLWNDRKRIIQITAVVTFIGVIYALLATPLYKSTITMYPSGQESGGKLSQLKGMASTFGLDIGGPETSFNIPDIVQSRRIKKELIYHKWDTEEFDIPVNIIHYWEIDDTTGINLNPIKWIKSIFLQKENIVDYEQLWLEPALEKIDKRISVSQDITGLITVKVLMEEPLLAAYLANYVYTLIVDFTRNVQKSQAKLNREFIENRQLEVKEQLIDIEEVLKVFRERNRSIMESPQLQLELERLMREVEIKTQVYITLQQQYELARIKEVKETPSIIILDNAEPPIKKETPRRKLITILFMVIGFSASVVYIIIRNLPLIN